MANPQMLQLPPSANERRLGLAEAVRLHCLLHGPCCIKVLGAPYGPKLCVIVLTMLPWAWVSHHSCGQLLQLLGALYTPAHSFMPALWAAIASAPCSQQFKREGCPSLQPILHITLLTSVRSSRAGQ